MMIIVSHPTGNTFVRGVLRAAERRGCLEGFWTALALPSHLTELSILGTSIRREISSRSFPEVSWRRIHTRPCREMLRIVGKRLRWERLIRHETSWLSWDRVFSDLDQAVAAHISYADVKRVGAVYAYEDGALATFRVSRERGISCLYDLPIAHWRTLRRLLKEEAELHPAWAQTMEGLVDSDAKLARKDEEIALADRIVVASSFTRQSLEEHFGQNLPVTVAPYGAPLPTVEQPSRRAAAEPLHLFYAGHLSQRKGFAYLIAALQRADVPWRLTLAGPMPAAPPSALRLFLADPRCQWLGHVPHATLLEAMAKAHVFIFPSIVEGFGLVLYEAMAAGLPVITTPHTAGPDIMTSGREGYIVPIRDPDAIADRIAGLYADEDRRQIMAASALQCAASHGWKRYEEQIAGLLDEVLAR